MPGHATDLDIEIPHGLLDVWLNFQAEPTREPNASQHAERIVKEGLPRFEGCSRDALAKIIQAMQSVIFDLFRVDIVE